MNERDELIETMVRTFLEKSERQAYSDHRIDLDAMAAVLRVCVEDMLGEPSDSETEDVFRVKLGFGTAGKVNVDFIYGARLVIADRRARYAPPKPKTPEERVQVVREFDVYSVYLDKQRKVSFGQEPAENREEHAQIYRLGLIAELKQKEQQ